MSEQKFSWTTVAKFDDHADALKYKLALDQKDKPTKIRRRRDGFSVMQGTPVKKAKPKPQPQRKVTKRPRARNDKKGRKNKK